MVLCMARRIVYIHHNADHARTLSVDMDGARTPPENEYSKGNSKSDREVQLLLHHPGEQHCSRVVYSEFQQID